MRLVTNPRAWSPPRLLGVPGGRVPFMASVHCGFCDASVGSWSAGRGRPARGALLSPRLRPRHHHGSQKSQRSHQSHPGRNRSGKPATRRSGPACRAGLPAGVDRDHRSTPGRETAPTPAGPSPPLVGPSVATRGIPAHGRRPGSRRPRVKVLECSRRAAIRTETHQPDAPHPDASEPEALPPRRTQSAASGTSQAAHSLRGAVGVAGWRARSRRLRGRPSRGTCRSVRWRCPSRRRRAAW